MSDPKPNGMRHKVGLGRRPVEIQLQIDVRCGEQATATELKKVARNNSDLMQELGEAVASRIDDLIVTALRTANARADKVVADAVNEAIDEVIKRLEKERKEIDLRDSRQTTGGAEDRSVALEPADHDEPGQH